MTNESMEMFKISCIYLLPIEFFTEIRASTINKWVVFHVLDLIDDYGLLSIENSYEEEKGIKNDYCGKYLDYMAVNSVPFKNFFCYYSNYELVDIKLVGDLATKEVDLYFYDENINYEELPVEHIEKKVSEITETLRRLKGMEFYLTSIHKVILSINNVRYLVKTL